MPWRWALDLVTTVRRLRGRLIASSQAKRQMRSTPLRVNTATSRPVSSGRPPCTRPPTPAYSPSEFRSEEHTSELQSLMRISYAVFCLKKKITHHTHTYQKTRKTINTQPFAQTTQSVTP